MLICGCATATICKSIDFEVFTAHAVLQLEVLEALSWGRLRLQGEFA